jgi:hypothetical protein
MLMREQCFICTKNLSNINSILDAQHVKYSWRPHFEENKYILYFSKQNLYTCIPCGKQFFMWNLSKNKLNLLKNRTINGKQMNLPKLPCKLIEHCIMCKQETPYLDSDPLHLRQFYLKSMGQCCSSCYVAIHNTSTTCDDFEEEMYY